MLDKHPWRQAVMSHLPLRFRNGLLVCWWGASYRPWRWLGASTDCLQLDCPLCMLVLYVYTLPGVWEACRVLGVGDGGNRHRRCMADRWLCVLVGVFRALSLERGLCGQHPPPLHAGIFLNVSQYQYMLGG